MVQASVFRNKATGVPARYLKRDTWSVPKGLPGGIPGELPGKIPGELPEEYLSGTWRVNWSVPRGYLEGTWRGT